MSTAVEAPDLRIPQLPAGQKRILVRLPNWLGDVVMAAPAVAAIHAARPDAELIAQVAKPFLPLASLLPGVVEALPAGTDRGYFSVGRSAAALRERNLDAAVVFPRSLRASLAPRRAKIPQRVGYAGAGRSFTHAVKGWKPYRSAHRSQWFGLLARAFTDEPGVPLAIDVPEPLRAQGSDVLAALGRDPSKPLVVLEPGASYGPAKCWPAEHFGALARVLIDEGCDVATVGTADSRSREDAIVEQAGPGMLRGVGRTPDLGALIGLLAQADLVVSNDTGPMHLSAAVGVPVLALFGATDPVVSSPIGRGTRHLMYEPEPCSPCFLRTCPIPGHPCLTKLGPAAVHRRARALLGD